MRGPSSSKFRRSLVGFAACLQFVPASDFCMFDDDAAATTDVDVNIQGIGFNVHVQFDPIA